jgi:hypothetical protein
VKDKVERLAKGIFEYEQPAIVISEEMISAEVPAGEAFCGKFSVRNRDMRVMKGVLYSSDEVLELKERQFIGDDNEISYTVHGEYGTPGEVHKGTITIVREFGEVLLPFTVSLKTLTLLWTN